MSRKLIADRIRHSPWYQFVLHRLDTWYVDNNQTSMRLVLQIFFRKLRNDEIGPRANAVAFNLTLSVFPAIIFLFTLIPYIPIPQLDTRIMLFLGQVLPQGIYTEIATTIYDIVSRPRGNLLSLGFVFALFTATNGMMAIIDAFNRSYRTRDRRSFLYTRLIATGLTFMLAFVLFLAVVLLIVGNVAMDWIKEHDAYQLFDDNISLFFVSLLQYVVVFFVFFTGLSTIYYVAPAIHERWKFLSPGALISSLLSIGVTHLFSFYLTNFASYNKLYGSIGTFIGLMIWFLLLSFIILLGFEVNASLHEAKRKKDAILPLP
jgi:membrane protein